MSPFMVQKKEGKKSISSENFVTFLPTSHETYSYFFVSREKMSKISGLNYYLKSVS